MNESSQNLNNSGNRKRRMLPKSTTTYTEIFVAYAITFLHISTHLVPWRILKTVPIHTGAANENETYQFSRLLKELCKNVRTLKL